MPQEQRRNYLDGKLREFVRHAYDHSRAVREKLEAAKIKPAVNMGPYDKLFIYELSDEISVKGDAFGPDFIGCWNEAGSSFLFFSREHDEEVGKWLAQEGKAKPVSQYVMDYRDWQAGEDLKPFRAEKLVICPPWEEAEITEGEILIRLDPGVVFGAGLHPTTRGCLNALWRVYQVDSPQKVLDIGTGTGILAIAAAKLGARKVIAIDLNQLAVETARKNVLLNGVDDRVEVKWGEAEAFAGEKADLVLANLHFQAINALLKREEFLSKRWIVLSGLFQGQADGILTEMEKWRFKIHDRMNENRWATLVLRKFKTSPGDTA
jgi:ribosomal protein L11 methyltransferase